MTNFKQILIFGIFSLIAGSLMAAPYNRGYVKKNGTYVAPHYKSKSDHSKINNWSNKGSYNPMTGKKGYKKP